MFKVIATDVVISKGYDGAPALKFSENGESVRFRMSIWLLNGWMPMLWNSMSGATRASRKGYPCWK